MICPNCGAENPEERDFCQSCGAPLREPTPTPAPPPPAYTTPEAPTTSGLAVASLIMGIVGWFLLPLVGNVLAILFGHMAKREIAQSGGRLTGEVGVGVWVLGILAFVLFGVGICGCGTCTSFLAAVGGGGPRH